MKEGDFYGNEKAVLISKPCKASIIFTNAKGEQSVMKEGLSLEENEILDASFLSVAALNAFYEEQIALCKKEN